MKLIVFSQLLESLYNQGRITSDRKLDERDFEQLAVLARGEGIRIQLERAIKMFGMYSVVDSGLLQHYTSLEVLPIEGVGNKYVDVKQVMPLQNGYGVFNIIGTPNADCSERLYFSRLQSGTAWQINCDEMDENEVYFEPIGDRVRLTNIPDCAKELEVLVIKEGDLDTEIPTEIGYTILQMCFDIASKSKMFVVDSLDDYSPTDDQKRNLLAQFQANDEASSKSI